MTAATEPLTIRALRPGDAAAACGLSTEAGWNQTIEDWQLMLAAGEARGQLTPSGGLVATALILPYGDRIGWIAMVLTTERFRRRGLATANLEWAILRCDARGLIAGLDATPAGREVYRPLGFIDLWRLQRLRAATAAIVEPPVRKAVIRPMRTGDLPEVTALDALAFGAARDALLAHLHGGLPSRAWIAEVAQRITGFVLARPGRATFHLGPLVAPDADVATALAGHALRGIAGPVSIDVPDRQSRFRERLTAAGFAPVRPFTRMLRCNSPVAGGAELAFAIAGPELG